MTSNDPTEGLRYYPAFAVVLVALFVVLTLLSSAVITHGLVDQFVVPRVHPVEMREGDAIEVGSGGRHRAVLVRHADGTVTDAGELRAPYRQLRQLPSFLATALVFFPALWGLARVWPRKPAAPEPGVTPPQ